LFIISATSIADSGLKRLSSEQQLVHAQRMETVGQLAGGIAHDFNNMITAILGGTQLAVAKLEPGHPAREHLQVSQSASLEAASLVKKLLTYARALPRQTKILDLSQFIVTQEPLLRSFVGEETDFEFRLEEASLWVDVDPVEIEQVISNLLLNARDAVNGRGKVRLSAGLNPDGHIRLAVSDDGPGVNIGDQERVFEPFFTTRRERGGTGLGLSTVRSIIEASHGSVTIGVSDLGGALIEVLLPAAPGRCKDTSMVVPKDATYVRPGRVLVVDDDPLVLETVTSMLALIGLKSMGVGDASSALELLSGNTDFDFIVTDLVMPGMSGVDFINELRRRGDDRPIVLLSGYDEMSTSLKLADDEPDERVQKPVTLDELRRVVMKVQSRADQG